MKKQGAEVVRHIPWGYGVTRVTAMVVDPDRLYAYWEITNPDLDRARASLPQGAEARLVLRVFDVTGLIFDGTSAHRSLDVPIQRSDRQWFLTLGRPGQRAVVEIGLLGSDGSFAAMARSQTVDFPRRDPAPASEPEWRIARETVESGPKRLHLEPPSLTDLPPGSRGGDRTAAGRRTSGEGGVRAGVASEERLADARRPGGASEERLRGRGDSGGDGRATTSES